MSQFDAHAQRAIDSVISVHSGTYTVPNAGTGCVPMFVFSIKADKKQCLWGAFCVVAVAAAIVVSVSLPADRMAVGGRPVEWKASTAAERVALLEEQGYTVSAEEERVQEVRIPDEPDAVLQEYEALQESAGMSLQKYSGKRVKYYTYAARDTETAETVWIHLYVYRDRVVAGDITATDPEGTQKALL